MKMRNEIKYKLWHVWFFNVWDNFEIKIKITNNFFCLTKRLSSYFRALKISEFPIAFGTTTFFFRKFKTNILGLSSGLHFLIFLQFSTKLVSTKFDYFHHLFATSSFIHNTIFQSTLGEWSRKPHLVPRSKKKRKESEREIKKSILKSSQIRFFATKIRRLICLCATEDSQNRFQKIKLWSSFFILI